MNPLSRLLTRAARKCKPSRDRVVHQFNLRVARPEVRRRAWCVPLEPFTTPVADSGRATQTDPLPATVKERKSTAGQVGCVMNSVNRFIHWNENPKQDVGHQADPE